jgi:hypothetical protein
MPRFSSLKLVPSETRCLLRNRFERNLQVHRHPHGPRSEAKTFPDEVVLRLLLGLSIAFECEWERAHNAYIAARPPGSTEPELEDLVAAGWFRVVWGRISVLFDLAQAVSRAAPNTMTAFRNLLAKRHERTYRMSEGAVADPQLADLVDPIEGGELRPESIACQAPD